MSDLKSVVRPPLSHEDCGYCAAGKFSHFVCCLLVGPWGEEVSCCFKDSTNPCPLATKVHDLEARVARLVRSLLALGDSQLPCAERGRDPGPYDPQGDQQSEIFSEANLRLLEVYDRFHKGELFAEYGRYCYAHMKPGSEEAFLADYLEKQVSEPLPEDEKDGGDHAV
jgi:hypothetical protein